MPLTPGSQLTLRWRKVDSNRRSRLRWATVRETASPRYGQGGAAPRFVEADLVAYSGPVASGSFVQTLVLTDIATGWTECAPLLRGELQRPRSWSAT